MYFTYILYSNKLDLFYRGHASNVFERFKRHNNGMELFTRKGVPWNLLWYTAKDNKSEAFRLELKLKNLSQKRLIAFMLKHESDISSPDALLFLKQWSGC